MKTALIDLQAYKRFFFGRIVCTNRPNDPNDLCVQALSANLLCIIENVFGCQVVYVFIIDRDAFFSFIIKASMIFKRFFFTVRRMH